MKTWKKYCENVGGGLPNVQPNYSRSARSMSSFKDINIGQANLSVIGGTLQIDTANHSISLTLTPQQLQQLASEF